MYLKFNLVRRTKVELLNRKKIDVG